MTTPIGTEFRVKDCPNCGKKTMKETECCMFDWGLFECDNCKTVKWEDEFGNWQETKRGMNEQ